MNFFFNSVACLPLISKRRGPLEVSDIGRKALLRLLVCVSVSIAKTMGKGEKGLSIQRDDEDTMKIVSVCIDSSVRCWSSVRENLVASKVFERFVYFLNSDRRVSG